MRELWATSAMADTSPSGNMLANRWRVSRRPKRSVWQRIVTAATAMAMPVAMLVALPVLPAQAATNTLTLEVISARTEPRAFAGAGVDKGAPITSFKYIINEDNTGTTTQRSPALGTGCSTLDELS